MGVHSDLRAVSLAKLERLFIDVMGRDRIYCWLILILLVQHHARSKAMRRHLHVLIAMNMMMLPGRPCEAWRMSLFFSLNFDHLALDKVVLGDLHGYFLRERILVVLQVYLNGTAEAFLRRKLPASSAPILWGSKAREDALLFLERYKQVV